MCNTLSLRPYFFHVYFWLFTFWCHFFFVFVLASSRCVPAASFGPVLLVFRDRWAVSPLQLCQKRAEFHWTVYWPLVYTSHSLQINIRGMEMEAEGERAELQWRKTLSHFLWVIIKSPQNSFFPQVSNHLITQRWHDKLHMIEFAFYLAWTRFIPGELQFCVAGCHWLVVPETAGRRCYLPAL